MVGCAVLLSFIVVSVETSALGQGDVDMALTAPHGLGGSNVT